MDAKAIGDGLLRRLRQSPLLALVAVIYVAAFPYHPGLRSPNELCRLWQTRALAEFGTIELSQAMRTYGPVGDLSCITSGGRPCLQGLLPGETPRYYPSKAPLLSFLAVPVYAVLRIVGGGHPQAVPEVAQVFWSRLFLTVLPTLVALIFIRRFLRTYVSPAVADAVTATYALGSLAFSYSLLFMSHQTTAVLLFGCFWALWRTLRGEWNERWGYLAAGAFAAAAVSAEYTAALAVAVLVVHAAVRVSTSEGERSAKLFRLGRAFGLAVLGALPFVAFLAAYHHAAFGHPLKSGYQFLADAAYQPWHLGGFLGIRTPDPRAFALSFFSPLRGLFALSPFLLLAVPGMVLAWRGRIGEGLAGLSVGMFAAYAYFTSSFSYESWGWTTGPRHLTPLVPFLLLPVAQVLESLRAAEPVARAVGLGAAAAACAASVLVTGSVSLVNYIPDVVSMPLFGLALPLFRDGFLPPSALAMLGIPNPWSGGLLLAGLVATAAWIGFALIRTRPVALATCAVALAGILGLLAAVTRHDQGDIGAQGHLKSVWLAPSGRAIDLWR